MKSNAPWSVKGIERDARETAKEAARREGMTVGEWLNQRIYSHGQDSSEISDGEVEGLKLRDLVTAIEHLRNRVVEAENRNTKMVTDLSRNVGGFVDRVQRLERVKPAEGSYEDVLTRIERVERATGDRNRIDALKALEKAVAQVAVQFSNAHKTTLTRLDSAEQQLQEFAARVDKVGEPAEQNDVGSLKSAIEDLAGRVANAERIATEATQLKDAAADSTDPEFVERTGARLRVLGDEIKRGGDQIRSLENTIVKLSSQIEAAEKRSSDGVQKVAETIAEVRTQLLAEDDNDADNADVEALLENARKETEARIEELQRSLEDMNARFEEIDRTAVESDAATSIDDIEETVATFDDDFELETDISEDVASELAEQERKADSDAAEISEETTSELSDDDVDGAIDDIEEAVAALDLDDEPEDDPFAFADTPEVDAEATPANADENTSETAHAPIDEDDEATALEDISFELDDETEATAETDDDITIEDDVADADLETEPEEAGSARALLAEVRDALTGDGFGNKDTDDEIEDIVGDNPDDSDTAEASTTDDDDDEQAPNTASLDAGIVGKPVTTDESTEPPKNKDDYLKAARRRAKEANAARATATEKRPSLAHLTAKQRAILAARARQKRAQQEGKTEERAETAADVFEGAAAVEAAFEARERKARDRAAREAIASDETENTGGRFSKLTAALSSARSRLSRKKGEAEDNAVETEPQPFAATAETPDIAEAEQEGRNNDRAALESLQANASSKPVTIALGVAIVLAVAALIFLMKDFIFKPNTNPQQTATISAPAATPSPDAENTGTDELVSVPAAPAIDPQSVYLEAMSALGAAEDEASAATAISLLQDAAALGFPPAQLQLGELFKSGQGIDQDLGQARVWFRRAANGGNVLAMHRIGVMTARGDGGPADSQEAIAWFERAANYGLVDSQYNLGAIYHPTGDATSAIQDAGKAYYWYALAARNGDAAAEPLAAGVAASLSTDEKSSIDQRIAAWSANETNPNANLNTTTG